MQEDSTAWSREIVHSGGTQVLYLTSIILKP
jgi:hypothetical protein